MACVELVSKLKTEGATLAPCHAPSGKLKPRFPTGAFPFAPTAANIAKLL